MKLNYSKVATCYKLILKTEIAILRFGWYESGKAFIAIDDELLTFAEAFAKFVPNPAWNCNDYFYAGTGKYKNTIDGIVRYLVDKTKNEKGGAQ